MPTYYISKLSSYERRKALAVRVLVKGILAMVFYSAYASRGSLCVFSRDLSKCLECTYYRVYYNSNFSAVTFNRLKVKKQRLKAA
jgi:hypothetical protein